MGDPKDEETTDLIWPIRAPIVEGSRSDWKNSVSNVLHLTYQLNIVPISSEKSYDSDPFILHSLVSGCVEALKKKYTYERTEIFSVLLAIRLQQSYTMGF